MVTVPESTAAPVPYQCFSVLMAAWSPAGFESHMPARDTPLLPNCRRLKPTLLGVLNQWRSVSAKSVMRALAGASMCSTEEAPRRTPPSLPPRRGA